MSDSKKLSPTDYQFALYAQDGCNLSGIVFGFARVMQKICDEAAESGKGTEWKNLHPICVMYASKIASLTRCEPLENFSAAYSVCKTEAKKEPA